MASSSDFLELLPPLREVIRDHDLRAEKKLGQNFLLDPNLTDKIARTAGDLTATTVYEVGPGPGGLTRSLLRAGAQKVIAVEYDPRAIRALDGLKEAAQGRLIVHHADALQTDFLTLSDNTETPKAIVANLPYNIATPLLIGWLEQLYANPTAYSALTLMFQKEVAERITASCGGKAYGRLAILSQWLCETHIMFDVPPTAFAPPPKVTSSIVQLVPRQNLTHKPPFDQVAKITAAAFGQRRKMVRSSLKAYIDFFEPCGILSTARAEEISIDQFIHLALLLNNHDQNE